jgi:hypothetical protein
VNFPEVVSTVGLVNSAIGAIKSARELAKDTSATELREKIGAAYETLLDLREHALSLDEENRQLKAQLAAKAAYIGPVAPHGYFYEATDAPKQHPLCPTCFQSNPQRIGFMDESKPWNRGIRRECKLCGKHVYEKPMDLAAVMAARAAKMGYSR